jgi:hypothetical protein
MFTIGTSCGNFKEGGTKIVTRSHAPRWPINLIDESLAACKHIIYELALNLPLSRLGG